MATYQMSMMWEQLVWRKKNSFHKKKGSVADFEGLISRIEKVLSKEFVHNVFVTMCCAMNWCQDFLHEKTLLLKQGYIHKDNSHKNYH